MRTPWTVTDRGGVELDLREVSPQWVTDKVKRDAQEVAMAATMRTRIHDGEDLDQGTDLGPAKRAIRNIARVDPHLGDLAEAAAKGGLWAEDRLQRSRLATGACRYCGAKQATCRHLMYECPHFAGVRGEEGLRDLWTIKFSRNFPA